MYPAGGVHGAKARDSGRIAFMLETQLWVYWLLIALEHEQRARDAAAAHWKVIEGERRPVFGSETVPLLEAELETSLVAISASAHAIDAFFGAVNKHIKVDQQTRNAWHTNRTARHKRISETLKRGFEPRAVPATLAGDLKWLYGLRDSAVHFEAEFRPTGEHASGVSTADENIRFSAANASRAVDIASRILSSCLHNARPALPRLRAWTAEKRPMLEAIETRVGRPVFPQ